MRNPSNMFFAMEDTSAYFITENRIVTNERGIIKTYKFPQSFIKCVHENLPRYFDKTNKKSYHINYNRNKLVIIDYNNNTVKLEQIDTGENFSKELTEIQFIPYGNTFLLAFYVQKTDFSDERKIKELIIKKYDFTSKTFSTLLKHKFTNTYFLSYIGNFLNQICFVEYRSEKNSANYSLVLNTLDTKNPALNELKSFDNKTILEKTPKTVSRMTIGGKIFERDNAIFLYSKHMSLRGEQFIEVCKLDTNLEITYEKSFKTINFGGKYYRDPLSDLQYTDIKPLDFVKEAGVFYMIDTEVEQKSEKPYKKYFLCYDFNNLDDGKKSIEISMNYRAFGILTDYKGINESGTKIEELTYKSKVKKYYVIIDVPFSNSTDEYYFAARLYSDNKARKHSGYIVFLKVPIE